MTSGVENVYVRMCMHVCICVYMCMFVCVSMCVCVCERVVHLLKTTGKRVLYKALQ